MIVNQGSVDIGEGNVNRPGGRRPYSISIPSGTIGSNTLMVVLLWVFLLPVLI